MPLGPKVAFCPACRAPKQPSEVVCSQCGTRSCPSGHIIDSKICRYCGFEDRTWKPQARGFSLESAVHHAPGIPEVKENICPRCKVKTIVSYGRCHNCGFILGGGQSRGEQQPAPAQAPGTGGHFAPAGQQYAVQQQYPGTHDAKLAYVCPRCGARADPRTGSCQNCGYIGSLTYEIPQQHPPGGTSQGYVTGPPPRQQSFAGQQQLSHPQDVGRPCPFCGAIVPADSRFCRQCGNYSGPSRHTGAQGYNIGAAEKARSGTPMGMGQMTPSMETASSGGLVRDLYGPYAPEMGGSPVAEGEYPERERKAKVKEKKERPYRGERRGGFPIGLLAAVFVVAAVLVAMVMFVVSQIISPPSTPTTPTLDKTPPVVSEVNVTDVTASSATIEWTTNEKATSQIMLCDPDKLCIYAEPDATLVKNHFIVLAFDKLKIQLNTKYHITIESMDASGNKGIYEMDYTFVPGKQGQPPDTTPVGTQVGNRAPDIKLKNLQGADVTLSSFKGKLVMINFWHWDCGPCKTEMPHIQSVSTTYSAKPLVVLTVHLVRSGETAAAAQAQAQAYITSNSYTFPVLLDSDGVVKSTYNITSWPQTFFLDSTGIIRKIEKNQPFASKAAIESILNLLQ